MEIIIDFILHFDRYLGNFISEYGAVTYLILFLIVFCETGLVVTPFLPGDSLIFAAGAFCAHGSLNIVILFPLLLLAAVVGDSVNYAIGKGLSEKLQKSGRLKFIKREHLERTAAFFERHGGKTIVIARFIPIIRTFAPFVAGAGKMEYRSFFRYNVVGGLAWVALFSFGGFFFGALPWVQGNFSFIVIAIILISLTPPLLLKLAERRGK
ncbi:MAG: DedA family protein [Clostridiales bacterium]|nr:DedA family protein [Clostridiales bacterium]